MPKRWSKFQFLRLQRVFRRMARSGETTHPIALGVAIGMVIGMTPTVGLQMVIAAIVATMLRANRVAAVLPVWITNPATIIPIYSFNYMLGQVIVGGPGLSDFKEAFGNVIAASREGGFFEGIGNAVSCLASLGWEIQAPLWLGCLVVGFALAIPSYFITARSVDRIRKRLTARKSAREDRVTAILQKSELRQQEDSDAKSSTASDN